LDAGAPLDAICDQIASLGLHIELRTQQVQRNGFRALKLHYDFPPQHTHRHLRDIFRLLDGSNLTAAQLAMSRQIFQRLADAEAKVHGTTVEKVHFHEIGAVDSIADIVGIAVALDMLAFEFLACSPIPTGCGTIQIDHGTVSIPAPATAELLRNIPIAPSNIEAELTTPTGAAVVASLVNKFGPIPAGTFTSIGYGAGSRQLPQQANLLRLLVMERSHPLEPVSDSVRQDQVAVMECNLDDVSGQAIGYCMEKLFAAGALDAYVTPIQMKKNRPGVKLTILARPEQIGLLERIIFLETTSLGIRRYQAQRSVLFRQEHEVHTEYGPIQGKVCQLPDGSRRFAPEFDICQSIAAKRMLPLVTILSAAISAYEQEDALAADGP
jgi:uncharacterized protein (TIGR00299 family) protein